MSLGQHPPLQPGTRADRGVVSAEHVVERVLTLAFAPLHKRVFGLALGLTFALLMAVATIVALLVDPAEHLGLQLLAVYFHGYSVSWPGAVVGAAWAGMVGFVAGWFLAFCRNFVIATWLIYVRARANLRETRDFLDHL
jgi:hypothetical protein